MGWSAQPVRTGRADCSNLGVRDVRSRVSRMQDLGVLRRASEPVATGRGTDPPGRVSGGGSGGVPANYPLPARGSSATCPTRSPTTPSREPPVRGYSRNCSNRSILGIATFATFPTFTIFTFSRFVNFRNFRNFHDFQIFTIRQLRQLSRFPLIGQLHDSQESSVPGVCPELGSRTPSRNRVPGGSPGWRRNRVPGIPPGTGFREGVPGTVPGPSGTRPEPTFPCRPAPKNPRTRHGWTA